MSFGGLYISISGLQASRQSLDTVSHNIANANNKNYVRQSAMHASNSYTKSGDGKLEMGTGVHVNQVRQIRDEFLDLKIRREMPSFGYHYAKAQILDDVEGVFMEMSNGGIQKVTDDLWKNWNELFKDPGELTMRSLVHESAVAFTGTVNHISNQLNDIQQNLNKQILTKVSEVNSTLEGISKLNKSIKAVEGENSRMKANDYRDERNALIDRLSELVPITSYENSLGETVVSLHGRDLVNSGHVSKLDVQTDNKGLGHIYWEKSNEKIDLEGKGELGGFIDVRDKSLVEYKNRLDVLVGTMAGAINNAHEAGFDLKGDAGEPFFKGVTVGGNEVITAANIKVNPKLSDLNKIAASSTAGDVGNGEIAKQIYAIRNDKTLYENKTMNVDDYYRDLIVALGLEREESVQVAKNQGFLIKSLDEKRKGLSSVSLDEEMTDMIKFQHSYTANSRVINTLDEMIDTIVNRLGIVGR